MREHDWVSAEPDVGEQQHRDGVTLTLIPTPPMTMVSGDITQLAVTHDTAVVGLGEVPPTQSFLVRLARDRALWIRPPKHTPTDGWHDGAAWTEVDGSYAVVQVEGVRSMHLLQQGTSVNLQEGSPSATLLFAGQAATLTREGAAWWILVERAWLPCIWTWLEGADG